MEIIVDIKNAVYKERLVRCRDYRKKKACITFEGIANENGFCSLGEPKDKSEPKDKTEPQTENSTNSEKVQLKIQLTDEPQTDCTWK